MIYVLTVGFAKGVPMKSTISFNLKKYRKEKKMTQQEMAQALFVTPQAVSKWERGDSLPDISLVPQIARLFQISISDLWAEEAELVVSPIETLNQMSHGLIEDEIVSQVILELDSVTQISELTMSFDFFMLLTDRQKEQVVSAIIESSYSDGMIEDFYYYLSSKQKEKMVMELLENQRYLALESIIPMMSRLIRTKVLEGTIRDQARDFLEELFPFLNYSQKEWLVQCVKLKTIPMSVLDNYLTFFTESQREELIKYEED